MCVGVVNRAELEEDSINYLIITTVFLEQPLVLIGSVNDMIGEYKD